jgi:NADH-quinone oxidoreductase subunit J
VIIYIGAVAILFLFIHLMLNVRILELSKDLVHYFPIVGFFAFLFILNIFTMLFNKDIISLLDNGLSNQYSYTNWFNYVDTVTTIDYFGHLLYTHYLYFFLVSGIILLVSMIGAIILTSQINDKDYKEQDISQQLSRNSKNAIFLVKVK